MLSLIIKVRADDSDDNYCCQKEERQPSLDSGSTAHVFTVDQHEEGETDHVPPGGAVVLHAVEGPGHVAVAVVAAEVVHPPRVNV